MAAQIATKDTIPDLKMPPETVIVFLFVTSKLNCYLRSKNPCGPNMMVSEGIRTQGSSHVQVFDEKPDPQEIGDTVKDPEMARDEKITKQDDWMSDFKNPYNWPMSKRVYHTMIPARFVFVV